jgi:hypothetical protein
VEQPPKTEHEFLEPHVLKESMGVKIEVPRIELNPLDIPLFCKPHSLLHESPANTLPVRRWPYADLIDVQHTHRKGKWILLAFDQFTKEVAYRISVFFGNESSYQGIGQHFFKESDSKILALSNLKDFRVVFSMQVLHIHA